MPTLATRPPTLADWLREVREAFIPLLAALALAASAADVPQAPSDSQATPTRSPQ